MPNAYKGRTVLVVAAHSDDEVLGCAGTLLYHQARGDKIFLMFLTNGVGARGSNIGAEKRANASRVVANRLGGIIHTQLDFPDNRMDSIPILEIIKKIELVAKAVNPDIVYTHYPNDLNVDHKICSEAVLVAFRPLPNSDCVHILSFEVASSTEWAVEKQFQPNHFVNISQFLEKKKSLLKEYSDEIRDYPHSRSLLAIESLARWRGASVGVEAAEAFVSLRSLWK
jgi:LmbE family N-acetylglucosaminyl deacetylase